MASQADVALLLWGELGIGLIYGLPGYILFAMFEIVAKRRGTLEVFRFFIMIKNPFSIEKGF